MKTKVSPEKSRVGRVTLTKLIFYWPHDQLSLLMDGCSLIMIIHILCYLKFYRLTETGIQRQTVLEDMNQLLNCLKYIMYRVGKQKPKFQK